MVARQREHSGSTPLACCSLGGAGLFWTAYGLGPGVRSSSKASGTSSLAFTFTHLLLIVYAFSFSLLPSPSLPRPLSLNMKTFLALSVMLSIASSALAAYTTCPDCYTRQNGIGYRYTVGAFSCVSSSLPVQLHPCRFSRHYR